MMKKIIALFLLIFSCSVWAQEPLSPLIAEKKWEQLPPLFLDDSHTVLKDYFDTATAQSIQVIPSTSNHLTYKAKFSDHGEIGVIAYENKDGKYLKLKIKNQIKPLYFVQAFKKYPVENVKITIGDADIHFISGYFLETQPFRTMLIFKGRWKFLIKPGNEEERLTLKRKFKKDYFEETAGTGIFLLHQRDFLESLTAAETVSSPDEDMLPLFHSYRDLYGINVLQSGEYWYLPFSDGSNLVMFEKGKKSYYYYTYNENLIPDTQLTESDTGNMLLSYNAYQGLKLSFGEAVDVSRLDLDFYFDPQRNYISGTTAVSYNNLSNLRRLQLDKGLKLVRNLDRESKGLNVFRKKDLYYLMGTEDKTLSFYFSGNIVPSEKNLELFKPQGAFRNIRLDDEDRFYYLSREQNFYPNPGDEFFESVVTVKLPTGYNCLASGSLVEKSSDLEAPVFKFRSNGTKGISVVTGNFILSKKVDSVVPLHFYIYESASFPKRLSLSEVRKGFDFFNHRFGKLDLSAVNVLLKRARVEGGVSNTGFVVVHLPPYGFQVPAYDTINLVNPSLDTKVICPILIRDKTEDHILHELAHQWWGGVISWKSYRDVWMTEGLAHFSVLYYLKSKLPPKVFERLGKKLKRWINRFSDSGPIIYGTRINLLEGKYEAYQSVVYNKSAMVFLMLMDMLGEKEFERRLRGVLEKFKYKSISSMQFIREFSGEDETVSKFFKKWVYSRAYPEVELSLDEDDPRVDKKNYKHVVLKVKQLDTDFVFPMKLRVITRKGTSIEQVIVDKKEQKFLISRNATIREINVYDSYYLVKEKRQPSFMMEQK